MFNISHKKVGGLHFLKIGRLTVSWSVRSAEPKAARCPERAALRRQRIKAREWNKGFRYGMALARQIGVEG